MKKGENGDVSPYDLPFSPLGRGSDGRFVFRGCVCLVQHPGVLTLRWHVAKNKESINISKSKADTRTRQDIIEHQSKSSPVCPINRETEKSYDVSKSMVSLGVQANIIFSLLIQGSNKALQKLMSLFMLCNSVVFCFRFNLLTRTQIEHNNSITIELMQFSVVSNATLLEI